MSPDTNEYVEVSNIRQSFTKAFKKNFWKLVLFVVLAVAWDFVGLYFWADQLLGSDIGFLVLILPWIGILTWLGGIYNKLRKAFWEQLAQKYGWNYDIGYEYSKEKALVFQIGHSHYVGNGIVGKYLDRDFRILEYGYSIGYGKSKQDFMLTIFEIKFEGTFPHLYLDFRKGSHTNPPSSSAVAKISLPKEFEDKFRLYSPKEYEIETLEIFTPNVLQHLLDAGWNHDMEFVDGEMVFYREVSLNSLEELDAELVKVKTLLGIISAQLDRLKLTQIGDKSPLLK